VELWVRFAEIKFCPNRARTFLMPQILFNSSGGADQFDWQVGAGPYQDGGEPVDLFGKHKK
jgi:hypothetical protein